MEEGRLWNLTPYELGRSPHPIPSDDGRVIHTTGRLLEAELQCAICLEILKKTRTTKECLHRFCEECIKKALQNGNRECPNCRTKLVSMRALRPDPLFDDIIRTIFPDRLDSDETEGNSSSGSGPAPRVGPSPSVPRSLAFNDDVLPLEIFPYTEKVQHCAYLLKNWRPRRRLVRVTSAGTASHVCKYILSRLVVENQNTFSLEERKLDVCQMELFLRPKKNQYFLIPNLKISLKEIQENFWKIRRPIQFYFAFKQNFKLNSV